MEERNFNLEEFAGGALSEKVNMELQKVLDNIQDPNTDANKVRTLELKLKFSPNSNRDSASVEIEAKTKLVPSIGVQTTIGIGKDGKGKVRAAEYKNQIPGQVEIKVDDETGDVEAVSNTDTIVDFRKANK